MRTCIMCVNVFLTNSLIVSVVSLDGSNSLNTLVELSPLILALKCGKHLIDTEMKLSK